MSLMAHRCSVYAALQPYTENEATGAGERLG
jgi:hypothetical protein